MLTFVQQHSFELAAIVLFCKIQGKQGWFSPPWNAPRPGWKTITQNSYILQVYPWAYGWQSTESQSSINSVKPVNCPQRSRHVKNEAKSNFTMPVPVAGIVCGGLQSIWAAAMIYQHYIHQLQSCCQWSSAQLYKFGILSVIAMTLFQYPKILIIVRSREVSNSWDW